MYIGIVLLIETSICISGNGLIHAFVLTNIREGSLVVFTRLLILTFTEIYERQILSIIIHVFDRLEEGANGALRRQLGKKDVFIGNKRLF